MCSCTPKISQITSTIGCGAVRRQPESGDVDRHLAGDETGVVGVDRVRRDRRGRGREADAGGAGGRNGIELGSQHVRVVRDAPGAEPPF
jgi:hypothetical protein